MYKLCLNLLIINYLLPMWLCGLYLFFAFAEIQQFLDWKVCQRQLGKSDEFLGKQFFRNFIENFWRAIDRNLHHRFDDSARRVFAENRRNFNFFVAFIFTVVFRRRHNFFERLSHLFEEKLAQTFTVGCRSLGGDEQKALEAGRKRFETKFFCNKKFYSL